MMKKNLRSIILLVVTVLYIVGNNQIAYGDTAGSMVSQSSISFDKTYIPQPVNPVIPNGSQTVPTNHGTLPRTGTKSGLNWELLGFSLLASSLLIKKNQKNRRIKK
jgi:LPXTG-motif cell wall-anchored protein